MRLGKEWIAPFIPLCLLFFLPFAENYLAKDAFHPYIALLRYYVIPIVGSSIALASYILVRRLPLKEKNGCRHETIILILLSIITAGFFGILGILKEQTFHYGFFDLGIEIHFNIWKTAISDGLIAKFINASQGHFQPLYIIHSYIYKLIPSSSLLLFLQSIITISGIIPLYLLAKERFDSSLIRVGIILVYLLYPAVEYNTFNDHHLDHVFIPVMLWAYYFAERSQTTLMILILMVASAIKEPLILGVSFFGIYLFWGKKRRYLGSFIFLFFFLSAYWVIYFFIPSVTPFMKGISTANEGTFIINNISEVGIWIFLKELITPKKILFVFFGFAPLLFLPLLSPSRLLPVIPIIGIQILSRSPLHQSVDSHYMAGIIPSLFVALVFGLSKIKDRWGEKNTIALVAAMIIMTLSFNIAHSPSPLSINFWKRDLIDAKYHYSSYLPLPYQDALKKAVSIIPSNIDTKVVVHNQIFADRLAQRHFFYPFPEHVEDTDYVIWDENRKNINPNLNDPVFEKNVQDAKQYLYSGVFRLIFDQEGVLVFKRL